MTKIGPYEILDTLHSGPRPLYKVKAVDGRILALKSVAVEGLSDEMRERFTREAEICRSFDHPNLVRVYDAGEANGVLYQAMDLLEGNDLAHVLASGRQFTWSEKLSIMEQICEGLAFAHERNMVHRDIKPANIFLEDSGQVRLLDFGMARVASSELTRVGSTMGTLNYMSPEQIRGERCTAAADVFSAGIVFFQLASGRHPFSARDRSLPQVVSAIVFDAPPKLTDICPDAPEGLEFLLNKAMAKSPADRFPGAAELKQAIVLCRFTLEMAGSNPQAAPSQSPAAASTPQTQPADGEKTKVMRRAAPPPVSPEDEKTQAFRAADFKPKPVALRPAAPPPAMPAPKPPKPPVTPAARFRYCPSCTFANPLHATVCGGCGVPLTSAPVAETPPAARNWSLYIAVSIAVLLAIALVVVLMVKR